MRSSDQKRIVTNLVIFIICAYFALPSTGMVSSLIGDLPLTSQSVYSPSRFKFDARDEGGKKVAFMEIRQNDIGYELKDIGPATKGLHSALQSLFETENIAFTLTEKPGIKGFEYQFPEESEGGKIKTLVQSQSFFGSLPSFLLKIAPRNRITLGLDLQGGIDLLYEIDRLSLEASDNVENAKSRSIEIIRTRIDAFGVGEVSIKGEGESRIRIQIPGRKDAEAIEKAIVGQGKLTFHLLKGEGNTSEELEPFDEALYLVLPNKPNLEGKATGYAQVFKEVAMHGKYLKDARTQFDEFGRPTIGISFNSEGAKIFGQVTGKHVNDRLAIVLDDKMVYSAPVINDKIMGGEAVIMGQFTLEEANQLSTVLKIGALPARLIQVQKNTVGPNLGKLSIDHGRKAMLTGFMAVLVFMCFIYRLCGFVSVLAVFFNLFIIFAALVMLQGTLTLPGLAGLVLSVGMAVDANIIIFERIKEEFLSGKTVSSAIESGFDRAWICILDSNLTTILTVIVLFFAGTGPIKGFAVTLGIGLVANMFTAVYFVKTVLDLLYVRSRAKTISIGI